MVTCARNSTFLEAFSIFLKQKSKSRISASLALDTAATGWSRGGHEAGRLARTLPGPEGQKRRVACSGFLAGRSSEQLSKFYSNVHSIQIIFIFKLHVSYFYKLLGEANSCILTPPAEATWEAKHVHVSKGGGHRWTTTTLLALIIMFFVEQAMRPSSKVL